ncbi:MAG: PEP-CTERM sorting domain-containing protein, partial [Planctomycetota bacterium]|nr:PEP-CTERM sorting domain-containing protein [Planctomycetota bacterium]
GYTMLRAASASSGEVTVFVDGTTGDSNVATGFGANDVFARSFTAGSAKPTGTTVALSWADAGNDVAIDDFSFTVQAIPEPTVLAPMALAGMGMFLRRRRA